MVAMEKLLREPTDNTPAVVLDPTRNTFKISGKVLPKDVDAFFEPILDWIDQYIQHPNPNTCLELDLYAFNISSSKRILFLLYKLNDLHQKGHKVSVKWYYKEGDDDMLEVGQDYACMIKAPFEVIGYSPQERVPPRKVVSLGAA